MQNKANIKISTGNQTESNYSNQWFMVIQQMHPTTFIYIIWLNKGESSLATTKWRNAYALKRIMLHSLINKLNEYVYTITRLLPAPCNDIQLHGWDRIDMPTRATLCRLYSNSDPRCWHLNTLWCETTSQWSGTQDEGNVTVYKPMTHEKGFYFPEILKNYAYCKIRAVKNICIEAYISILLYTLLYITYHIYFFKSEFEPLPVGYHILGGVTS